MAAQTVAAMLMQCLLKEKYRTSVTALLSSSAIDYQEFMDSSKAEIYHVDTSAFVQRGIIKPSGMFELFGMLSADDSKDVRENVINMVLNIKTQFAAACCIPLLLKGVNIDQWINMMSSHNTPGDEMSLFALSKIYMRHASVVTKMGIWTTMDLVDVSDDEILEKSDIKLLHMGQGLFGVLRKKVVLQNPSNILRNIPHMGRRGQRKAIDLSSARSRTRGRNTRNRPLSRVSSVMTNNTVVSRGMSSRIGGTRGLRGMRLRGQGRGRGRDFQELYGHVPITTNCTIRQRRPTSGIRGIM